jgi:hypothetical protein
MAAPGGGAGLDMAPDGAAGAGVNPTPAAGGVDCGGAPPEDASREKFVVPSALSVKLAFKPSNLIAAGAHNCGAARRCSA